MGEPAGIGPEIILKAYRQRTDDVLPFYAIGDAAHFEGLAAAAGMAAERILAAAEAAAAFKTRLPLLDIGRLTPPPIRGEPNPAHAGLVIGAIDRAIADCRAGAAAGMVTAPIQKETLYAAGFAHPGHTEYIAARLGGDQPLMMLAGAGLRVALATIHLPLRDVPAALSTGDLIAKGAALAAALRCDFGIASPRIAVAALNPHAGEGGALGREEIDIIAPAIRALEGLGIAVRGPLPADTLFHAAARKTYDAVLAMYHDQALIPLKTLDFHAGVNVTLGLSILRTSPDHGTALDIAGRGIADAASFIAALRLAADIAGRRRSGYGR